MTDLRSSEIRELETGELRAANAAGYRHMDYAGSLAEFGTPRRLPACDGWLLKRPIANPQAPASRLSPSHDAMGPYPLFSCSDWSRLSADLEALAPELVSVALVADPFGDYTDKDLKSWFRDVVSPFKSHYVVDLTMLRRLIVCEHHRRNALQALHQVHVAWCAQPLLYLDDWVRLYDNLIARHKIDGLHRFSRRAFYRQLQTPGIVALRAVHQDETIAMLLWYVMGDVAYYHLGASNPAGYRLGASFALFWEAIDYFAARGLRWLNLGGGAGVKRGAREEDGLSRFKRGWATGTRTAYFCGRILDPSRYEQLVRETGHTTSAYFPAYRHGEFQ